ncbi:tail tape measure protein [Emcibacter sp.]|uniref:tail tape measure protein n=1 Tax=Emcibacter sp. TaxID=1979954 RepID=UPI003A8D6718
MSETILDSLVVKLRADTSGLKGALGDMEKDLGRLEGATSNTADGMSRALGSFVRNGELSFESLRQTALDVLDDILGNLLNGGFSGGNSGGTSLFANLATSLFGREGGGAVSPEQPYLVGEKGPEVFIPHTAGRIAPGPGAGNIANRTTNITINVTGQNASPQAGRKSAGQIAVAVRRAVERAERNL